MSFLVDHPMAGVHPIVGLLSRFPRLNVQKGSTRNLKRHTHARATPAKNTLAFASRPSLHLCSAHLASLQFKLTIHTATIPSSCERLWRDDQLGWRP